MGHTQTACCAYRKGHLLWTGYQILRRCLPEHWKGWEHAEAVSIFTMRVARRDLQSARREVRTNDFPFVGLVRNEFHFPE